MKQYLRQCRRCDKPYRTTHKYSLVCPKCCKPSGTNKGKATRWTMQLLLR